ncbi:hypothetical protein CDL12_02789 [Handroanthus impetiginosus]|uniref:Uncharacterized protein n=1 Tax=Handroanthus impetiginosus TaxID=429701 RepID=A0A2G9I407_9LAMI|nr:hypothetical protein CDL12_02789 [Handroanthus impetiginosus]
MRRIERQETTEGPIDDEQICAKILGYKSGYIDDRGASPKPNKSLSKQSFGEELDKANKNVKITQEQAKKAEQQVLVFSEQLKNQKCVIEELKEGLVATQRAMLESQKCTSDIMTFLPQFCQTSHV